MFLINVRITKTVQMEMRSGRGGSVASFAGTPAFELGAYRQPPTPCLELRTMFGYLYQRQLAYVCPALVISGIGISKGARSSDIGQSLLVLT